MTEVTTKIKHFYHASALEVEVGTTGLRGGDAGHGGRTYLRLKVSGGDADFCISQNGSEVTLILAGDAELITFTDGLKFAAEVLQTSQSRGTADNDVPVIAHRSLD